MTVADGASDVLRTLAMATPNGPSFLTTPPVAPVSPEPRGVVIAPPASREPARVIAPVTEPARHAPVRREVPRHDESVGDGAGEHLMMTHGSYSAWLHVVLAFVLEVAVIGAIPMYLFGDMLHLGDIGTGIGVAIGLVGSWLVFRDRWRCIEAFSSRFCSGLMNLSILYVPFVAFVYANVRGIAKLRR